MKFRLWTLLFLFVPLTFCFAQFETDEFDDEPESSALTAEGAVEPYDLRLEFLSEPRGVDELKPRFSWKLRCVEGREQNGQYQSAYRIVVYKTKRTAPTLSQPVETVWDSGQVGGTAGKAQLVEYAGKALEPKSEYTWTLTVWDRPVVMRDDEFKPVSATKNGVQTVKEEKDLVSGRSSEPVVATFSMGLFPTEAEPNPWKGKWIGLDAVSLEDEAEDAAKLTLDGSAWIWTDKNGLDKAPVGKFAFRKTFDVPADAKVKSARLALTADNGFTAFLNGKEVGRGSNFKSAQLLDLRGAVQAGSNLLAVEVGNYDDSNGQPNPAGLLGVLRIELEDGKTIELKTDESWKATDGVPAGFVKADFDDTAWKTAVKLADVGGGPWGGISIGSGRPSPPARYFIKHLNTTDEPIKDTPVSAKAYIAGLGYYELMLQNQKIGDHLLDPVLTDYDKRVPYVTYDIDPTLFQPSAGTKKLEIVLGNGRYFAPRLTDPAPTRTFGFPKVLFQLELEYKDGSTETIVSDESWMLSTGGPIRDNNDYDGEIFDSRNKYGRNFSAAQIVEAPKGMLAAQMMPPMRAVEEFPALSCTEVKPGVWVFDFGVNLVGNCEMILPTGLPEGTRLQLRHAETLQTEGPDKGMLYVANLRGALCRDIYIASGKEKSRERYIPTFSYHGFRFAELTGLPEGVKPTTITLTARAINTDLAKTGNFETSDETINAVYRNVVRGTQGNYLSIPTDCPQRDERQGWQGDRAGEALGEMFMFDNVALYTKWLIDIQDSQRDDGNLSDVCPNFWSFYSSNMTWPSAFTFIPDSIYTMYGDRRPIERHYDAMKRWLIDHMGPFVKDGITDRDNYGDWCVPPERPELIHSQDPARRTSRPVLATTYYIRNLDIMTNYARMLGKDDDAKQFAAQAAEMRKAFNDTFLDKETGKYDNGTQTSCVLPLCFGIVPDDSKQKVFETLVNNIETVTDYHIGTGLVGGQWINRVLSDNGRADISYRFATNKTYPSWGYMVEQGATTIWELWNGNTADPAMNSGNHVMLVGDLVIWYYEYLAGIKADPERPGFEHIIMKPHPVGDLRFVDAEFDSVRGPIKSRWERDGEKFRWEIEIPVGSTATVSIPGGETKAVPSGKHAFETTLN